MYKESKRRRGTGNKDWSRIGIVIEGKSGGDTIPEL
jgi:hypothetical protein